MARDYKREYDIFHSPDAAANRRANGLPPLSSKVIGTKPRHRRNAANKKLKPPPGKDVHHKVSIKRGGGDRPSNLAVRDRSSNRADKES